MRNLKVTYQVIVGCVFAFIAFGCSQDNSNNGGNEYPGVPNAVATTASKIVTVGTLVQLDGSKSKTSDKDNLPLRFHWYFAAIPAGSSAKFDPDSLQNPWFIADAAGEFVVMLTVDNGVWRSDPVEVKIKVNDCFPEVLPPDPKEVVTGTMVQVSPTVTEACGERLPYQYQWSFSGLPTGSDAILNNTAVAAPSFIADVAGEYVLSLSVTDALGRRDKPISLTVTATAAAPSTCGKNLPVIDKIAILPEAPIAGQAVQLTAYLTDADTAEPCNLAESFSYAWTIVAQPAGSYAVLNNSSAVNPSFVADVAGEYRIELVVADSRANVSVAATTTVSVVMPSCGYATPTAQIEAIGTYPVGDQVEIAAFKIAAGVSVQLSGRASSDADNSSPCSLNQELFYSWRFLALPAASTAALNDDQIINPSFNADKAGDYIVGLSVMDSTGLVSKHTTVTVTAK